METKLVTNQVRLARWAQIVQDRNASGLTIREYCERNGLSRGAYFYWLRKLREAAIENAGSKFVELQSPPELLPEPVPLDEQEGPVVIEFGNARIHVSSPSSRDVLSMVMEVLSHA